MDNLFTSLKKLMYEYNNLEELTPRRKDRVLTTYSKFENDYEFVDELVPSKDQVKEEEV
tara:strand:+ start:1414 stop:1590 length:177 start_codon:yes stop_codon:yes gene_type:complete